MPRPNVIVGLYPDVPAFRGVPQLVRSPSAVQLRALAIATAAIRGRLWRSAKERPVWGIFNQQNEAVIVPDSVLAFDNRNEARVSDFPVQQGAFASYNKVNVPYELVVRLSKGGDVESRADFLQRIDAVYRSLALYYVLTPERTYLDVNVTRYEVTRRGSRGAYFLTEVDLFFREIRQVAAQYSTAGAATRNAEEPAARPSISQGVVQPQPPPPNLAGLLTIIALTLPPPVEPPVINNPVPVLLAIDPNTTEEGSGIFVMALTGSAFVPGSLVLWNGTPLSTTYVSPIALTAVVPGSFVATAGAFPVTVLNPTPGGGLSGPVVFTVTEPPPGDALLTEDGDDLLTEDGDPIDLE